jgi:hypothetical protein
MSYLAGRLEIVEVAKKMNKRHFNVFMDEEGAVLTTELIILATILMSVWLTGQMVLRAAAAGEFHDMFLAVATLDTGHSFGTQAVMKGHWKLVRGDFYGSDVNTSSPPLAPPTTPIELAPATPES